MTADQYDDIIQEKARLVREKIRTQFAQIVLPHQEQILAQAAVSAQARKQRECPECGTPLQPSPYPGEEGEMICPLKG